MLISRQDLSHHHVLQQGSSSRLDTFDFKPMLARSADGGITWREPGFIWPEPISFSYCHLMLCLLVLATTKGGTLEKYSTYLSICYEWLRVGKSRLKSLSSAW